MEAKRRIDLDEDIASHDDTEALGDKTEVEIANSYTEAEIAASDTGEGNIDAPDETGVLAAAENLDDTEFQEDS